MPEKTGRTRSAALKIFPFILIPLSDQLLKVWITSQLYVGESRTLIPNVLHLTLVHNTGTAFGLFQNANLFFIFLSIIVIAVLVSLRTAPFFPLSLLIGGAVGNLIDRIRLGYVVDFIDLRVWPVFNLADSCITIGILWLMLSQLPRAVSSTRRV